MFFIRKSDFAMLYRAKNNFSKRDLRQEQEFRSRNPECPQILNAETYEKALVLNAQIFFYM